MDAYRAAKIQVFLTTRTFSLQVLSSSLFNSWSMCKGQLAIWVDRSLCFPQNYTVAISKQAIYTRESLQILESLVRRTDCRLEQIDKRGAKVEI